MNTNYYHKTQIKDGKYLTVAVKETIESEKEIVSVDDTIFIVTHCGAYGQIKIWDGFRYFIVDNQLKYAVNPDFDKVLDLTNANFNISREEISKLHNDIYLKRTQDLYWIEI